MALYSTRWSLVTKLVIFAILASKHGGQLLNEVFIYSKVQDIWNDGEFSKWLLSPLDQKLFQKLVFKAFKIRVRSGCVDR